MEKYYTNRLLDLAHSRYRPGIALKYRNVHISGYNLNNTKKVRDSIYLVVETVKDIELEFFVDVDIGCCSCPVGFSGAACKHQAAIAIKYKIFAVNIPPFHSKEARYFFAVLARGEDNEMDINFYSDLSEVNPPKRDITGKKIGQFYSDDHLIDNDIPDEIEHHASPSSTISETHEHHWEEQIQGFHASLNSIVEDLMHRVKDMDTNVISGVCKFIRVYNAMKNTHAPGPTIAHALHKFATQDSK